MASGNFTKTIKSGVFSSELLKIASEEWHWYMIGYQARNYKALINKYEQESVSIVSASIYYHRQHALSVNLVSHSHIHIMKSGALIFRYVPCPSLTVWLWEQCMAEQRIQLTEWKLDKIQAYYTNTFCQQIIWATSKTKDIHVCICFDRLHVIPLTKSQLITLVLSHLSMSDLKNTHDFEF